jgi:hypothetical protein
MAQVVKRRMVEVRKRGIFGWIFLIIFWVANGLMALWLFATLASWGEMASPTSEAEKVGAGLGMVVGLGVIFSIWLCVAGVTGLLAFMTRGRKEIVEMEID